MNKFFNESKYFFRIGFPMLGSQLSFMIMSATDTIVAGRAGADQLAGLVIANSFTYPIFMFMAGIIFSVNTRRSPYQSLELMRFPFFQGLHF